MIDGNLFLFSLGLGGLGASVLGIFMSADKRRAIWDEYALPLGISAGCLIGVMINTW